MAKKKPYRPEHIFLINLFGVKQLQITVTLLYITVLMFY